ncbi:Amino acid transporter [Lasiodiplodia theobromae]|uniref:Amino acid transporter n=1 Tax=Lasiodiplodia theobromae TaxID=45133 RepID=UPI0015C3D996|nr:Amino acid transporter [Lasiodiplodia theobromae]KAF4537765.1 Amino acid transporter [Lasiodiplodia theobromae]
MVSPFLAALALSSLVLPSIQASVPVKQAPECTALNQRKSWTSLSDAEKKSYIDAELCLMNKPSKLNVTGSKNLWGDLMYTHINQANVIHNTGSFLPWHRLYMRVHEIYLQTECGYNGSQPYWNELEDAEAGPLNESAVFDTVTGFGSGNVDANGCVTDGPFVNLTIHLNLTSTDANLCLTRDLNQSEFNLANSTYVDECQAIDTYADSWNCWGTNPHLAGHFGVGGTMLDVVSSPGDPLFYLHHTNLDRLWWRWQMVDLENRLVEMTGQNVASDEFITAMGLDYPGPEFLDYDGDEGNMTTLNHNLWTSNLLPNVTIAQVMDLRGSLICAEYID